MKITVINGYEKRGVTYQIKELFLEPFRDKTEITEFYLPKDCPNHCGGCMNCFFKDEKLCKDAEYVQKLEKAIIEADLLVFDAPVYVMHTTGAMKAMLDHFGYRFMVHRPAKEMFGKRAVIITQCLGSGDRSAAKDIKDSLSWWGISSIKTIRFRLMGEVHWDKLSEAKRKSMETKLKKTAAKILAIDCTGPAHTGFAAKCKFYMVRMLQKMIGKSNPESADYLYWKENGWLGNVRPWKG